MSLRGTRSASRSPDANALGASVHDAECKRVTPGPANHAESSACFACIVFFICAKILSCFAAPQGLHRGSRTDAIAATAEPLPGAAQSVGSSCWGTGPLDWCREIGVGGGPADASHRTQPRYGVRYNTGLIFLFMLREPVKLSTPGDRRQGLEPQITQMIRAELRATGTTHRPCGAVYFALFAFFAVPILAARYRSTEGQNGASRGGLVGGGTGGGPDPGKGGHRLRRTWFLRNRATTLPPGQASSRRVRPGPGHHPAEGRAQVAADVVFAKLRNDPPAGAGSSRRVRHGRGHDPGKDRHRSRRTWFLRNRATTLPPGRLLRRATGRGHDPGKDGHRSRRTWFLRNCATTLPPGQAPLAGFGPGGGTTRGRTGTGRGGRGFCEIAQRPSRRGRLLPPGSAGRGHDPGKDGHRSRRTWFLRNCATTLPPGQAPPAGFGAGGGTTRGRTGTGRGGRGFCEIAQRPSRRVRPRAGARTRGRTGTGRGGRGFCEIAQRPSRRVRPGGGTTRGRTGTGRGGRGFCEIAQRPSRRGRLLPPGSARAGFREMRNDPRVRCERVCPWVRCPEGVRDATVRHWPGGGYERVGSLGPRTLTRVAARPDLGPLFAAQARRRER